MNDLSPGDRLLAAAAGRVLTGLMASTRMPLIAGADIQREIMDAKLPAIYVLWHGRLLMCSYRFRKRDLGTLITLNRDGDLIAGMIERWGYRVARGSSSRGSSSAMRELLRMLRGGRAIAVTPDGPRGPRQQMKEGPIQLARMTGAPLIPVTSSATRFRAFGSWDRFVVPMPFARCPTILGEPIFVPRSASERDVRRYTQATQAALNRYTEQVDEAAGVHA